MIRGLGIALAIWGGFAQAQAPVQKQAQAPESSDAMALLGRIYQATEKLSYSGTFVYQQGKRSESSRITRVTGTGSGGDFERVEVLDGRPREIVRTRDTVRCYMPDSHTVKVERRTGQRSFPAMLPERISELSRNYSITRGEPLRIAGYDCDAVVLTPKDDLRYGYKLWADAATGMLLEARTVDRNGETIEQFVFTQLSIGSVPHERVKSLQRTAQHWRIEDAAVAPANVAGAGWTVGAALPGFHKIVEVTRRLGEARPVSQVVYSDGLAAVSVFIEPAAGRAEAVRPGPSSLGAFQIYTREVANHIVTVVGDAPAASVQRVAATVEYKRPQ